MAKKKNNKKISVLRAICQHLCTMRQITTTVVSRERDSTSTCLTFSKYKRDFAVRLFALCRVIIVHPVQVNPRFHLSVEVTILLSDYS